MKTYSIYYVIPSSNMVLSFEDAIQSNTLVDIFELLGHLKKPNDLIYIYLNQEKLRLQICDYNNQIDKYILEIHHGRKGVCFYKQFSAQQLMDNLDIKLSDYIAHPIENGFVSETF